MATPEMGMADYFLQGFGSMLPDNHPARADLMQAPRLGKEKHTGLVAYELAELAVDWLQELVGEEGGDKKLLDNLPAPNVDLEGRRRRLLHAGATGPLSQEAAEHALKVQELFSEGRLFPEAERAGACFYVLHLGRKSIDDALATEATRQAAKLNELGNRHDPEDPARLAERS
ncbi:MAG: hypothetical protein E6G34_01320 [Actinobacteria bacterium]|nr:MAG: hypothetical protein E6G34_01320 [Actinomycetota bacterium]